MLKILQHCYVMVNNKPQKCIVVSINSKISHLTKEYTIYNVIPISLYNEITNDSEMFTYLIIDEIMRNSFATDKAFEDKKALLQHLNDLIENI